MARTISVRVVDKQGYGLPGYKITVYSDTNFTGLTDYKGECKVTVEGNDEVYFEKTRIAHGMESDFQAVLIVKV